MPSQNQKNYSSVVQKMVFMENEMAKLTTQVGVMQQQKQGGALTPDLGLVLRVDALERQLARAAQKQGEEVQALLASQRQELERERKGREEQISALVAQHTQLHQVLGEQRKILRQLHHVQGENLQGLSDLQKRVEEKLEVQKIPQNQFLQFSGVQSQIVDLKREIKKLQETQKMGEQATKLLESEMQKISENTKLVEGRVLYVEGQAQTSQPLLENRLESLEQKTVGAGYPNGGP